MIPARTRFEIQRIIEHSLSAMILFQADMKKLILQEIIWNMRTEAVLNNCL